MKTFKRILIVMVFLLLSGPEMAPALEEENENMIEITNRDWLDLVRRYSLPSVSGDCDLGVSGDRLAAWWDLFGDEVLTQLIRWSFQNNREIRSASAKVLEARAQLGVSRSELLPQLDGQVNWNNSQTSKNSSTAGGSSNLYGIGIDASWEIDIFGGRREEVRAAEATLESEYATLHDVWVTLSSEVALNYVSLRTLQERLEVAQHNLRIQMDTLEMLQSQQEAGLRDALAVFQALYTFEQTKASIPPILQSVEETTNALAVLVGEVPGSLGDILAERRPIPQLDVSNLVGIPAETLRQRPDIRAAERQWAAQTAKRKSAERDRLPKFSLLGSIGLESVSTGSIFSSDSYGFSLGPQITLPIFHGGQIRRNIQVQSAREEQYFANYEQTVLYAVSEVRDALTANAQEALRNQSLQAGLTAAVTALEIAHDKYRQGLSDFNNVLSALQAVSALEDDYAISQGQKVSNVIALFKALGGGWEPLYAQEIKTLGSAQTRQGTYPLAPGL